MVFLTLFWIFEFAAADSATDQIKGEKSERENKIGYVRPDIPSVPIPPYQGERYEDLVPDTLDLAEMATLSLTCLTEATDPEWDYELYWLLDLFRNPPIMLHDFSDWCQLKFMESLPLLRIISGSEKNIQVDRAWTDMILKSIGPDGLFYMPMSTRPWAREGLMAGLDMLSKISKADGTTVSVTDPSYSFLAHPYTIGRSASVMIVYYLHDRNPMWLDLIKAQVDRAIELAVDKGDYAYFPPGNFEPNAKVDKAAPMPVQLNETGSRVTQGLVQYYRITGYEPAKELARKLVNYIVHQTGNFDAEGHFLVEDTFRDNLHELRGVAYGKGQEYGGHYHNHTLMLLSILEYAEAVEDVELLDFVKKSYDWAKTQGSDLVGFFPEFIAPDYPNCETCEVADMLAIGAKLSDSGRYDCWDDVDRWYRNQFFESQLKRADWIYRMAESMPPEPVAYNMTSDRVAERSLGGFAGWAAANDWVQMRGIQHCCTGNAARSIFYVWQRILEHEDGQLKINLLMNRASPWADVYSYIPYEGQVDIKMKEDCSSLQIHTPQWVETGSDQVSCTVNGKDRPTVWKGRYVELGAVASGDKVTMKFPISERTVKERIGGVDYTLVVKGNSVVFIDPPGKYAPLYQRDHYRENQVRWRKVHRFVSNELITY